MTRFPGCERWYSGHRIPVPNSVIQLGCCFGVDNQNWDWPGPECRAQGLPDLQNELGTTIWNYFKRVICPEQWHELIWKTCQLWWVLQFCLRKAINKIQCNLRPGSVLEQSGGVSIMVFIQAQFGRQLHSSSDPFLGTPTKSDAWIMKWFYSRQGGRRIWRCGSSWVWWREWMWESTIGICCSKYCGTVDGLKCELINSRGYLFLTVISFSLRKFIQEQSVPSFFDPKDKIKCESPGGCLTWPDRHVRLDGLLWMHYYAKHLIVQSGNRDRWV